MSTDQIAAIINRAEAMLHRARTVNAAQYTHGINSSVASIEWHLKEITAKKSVHSNARYLYDKTMILGGYLYALQNNL